MTITFDTFDTYASPLTGTMEASPPSSKSALFRATFAA
jgi:hypothetical protein